MIQRSLLRQGFSHFLRVCVKFVSPSARVLEIGGNVGRVSCVLATMGCSLVVLESSPEISRGLQEIRDRCKLDFRIVTAALSNLPLEQSGLTTRVAEGQQAGPGWNPVRTITWQQLVEHELDPSRIPFDTLVVDCEGAFVNILESFHQSMLESVHTIVLENDYKEPGAYERVKAILQTYGFNVVHAEPLSEATNPYPFPCRSNFYEVWKRNPTSFAQPIPSPPRPRAAVCLWGLLRSRRLVTESFDMHILRPLERMGFAVDIFVHTYRSSRVEEQRTQVLNPHTLDMIGARAALVEDLDTVKETLRPVIELVQRPEFRLFESYKTDAPRLQENYVLGMHSLDQVTSLMQRTTMTASQPSVVIFARPDVLFLEPLQPEWIRTAAFLVPSFGSWGGHNDRFCICPPEKAHVYGARIHNVEHLLRNVDHPNSEQLLALHLSGHSVKTIPFPMRRVREQGRMLDRDIGTLSVDALALFRNAYAHLCDHDFNRSPWDPAWVTRWHNFGFPIQAGHGGNVDRAVCVNEFRAVESSGRVAGGGGGTAGRCETAGDVLLEDLEIAQGGKTTRIAVYTVDGNRGVNDFRTGWACGPLEAALLDLGIGVRNRIRRDERLSGMQTRFVNFARAGDLSRIMAAVANLVSVKQIRSVVCTELVAREPHTTASCILMAILYGMGIGRVYRPRSDESVCDPSCTILGSDDDDGISSQAEPFTFEHVQSAYEMGVRMVVVPWTDPPPPLPRHRVDLVFLAGKSSRPPRSPVAMQTLVADVNGESVEFHQVSTRGTTSAYYVDGERRYFLKRPLQSNLLQPEIRVLEMLRAYPHRFQTLVAHTDDYLVTRYEPHEPLCARNVPDDAEEQVEEIADILSSLHITHSDTKAEELVVSSKSGKIMLLDFGWAEEGDGGGGKKRRTPFTKPGTDRQRMLHIVHRARVSSAKRSRFVISMSDSPPDDTYSRIFEGDEVSIFEGDEVSIFEA
jgi:FkbM family methyltransferase